MARSETAPDIITLAVLTLIRRLIFAVVVIFCASHAHAATCPISSGSSEATAQGIINACGSGNTAVFAAGTYNFATKINWPCGVSITGPVAPLPYTAIINWTGTGAWAFQYPYNSSGSATSCAVTGVQFQYMQVQGSRPAGGGGAIYLANGGGEAPLIQNNWFWGINADQYGDGCSGCGEIYVDGTGSNQGHSVWTDLGINWNYFGNSASGGDCANLMSTFFYPYTWTPGQSANPQLCSYQSGYHGGTCSTDTNNYNNQGGECAAVSIHTSTTNLTIDNNRTLYLEEGVKFQEPSPNGGQVGCGTPSANQYLHTNANLLYNDFAGIHRIGVEGQTTPCPGSAPGSGMTINYNVIHAQVNPGFGSWELSLPQYNGSSGTQTNIFTNETGNIILQDTAIATLFNYPGSYTPGLEFWGNGQANYNLGQGNGLACLVSFGYGNTPWSVSNNTYQGNGNNICNEEHQSTNPNPVQSGNTSTATISALTSVTPSLSPASSTFGSSLNWTVTNPGTNRDANTNAWCTTNGNTPAPGNPTNNGSFFVLSGQGGTVSTTTTVKCVGMWGQLNQVGNNGTTWPTNMGYLPSSMVQATYTGGVPTTATPTFSPSTSAFYPTVSVTISDSSPAPTIYYTTNGTTPTTGSAVYTGPISISASTTVQAIATSSGLAQSPVGSAVYTYTPPPALTQCYQSNTTPFTNTLTVGGAPVQQVMQCQYASGPSPLACSPTADPNGSVVTVWGTIAPSIVNIGAVGASPGCSVGSYGPGCAYGVSAGSGNTTGSVTQNGVVTPCGQWTWNVSGSGPVATPTFTPPTESFNGTISVSAATTTGGATLHCTTDGTTPTVASPTYTGPFSVSVTTQIQCIGVASGFSNSTVGSATYTQATTVTPVFTPAPEFFTGSVSVTISSTTPSAAIYYTTNGSTPTTGSTPYTGPVSLSATTTVNALAVASGYQNSSIGTAVYTLGSTAPTSCSMITSPSTSTLTVGGSTTQLVGQCFYVSSGLTLTCSPGPDSNGNRVTSWGTTSGSILGVGAIGGPSPGVASGVLGGSASATAAVGSTPCTSYAFTVSNPTVSSVAISLQGGGTTVQLGSPTQACATISYNGSVAPTVLCNNGPDMYGTTAGSWTSSVPGNATISGTGLVTGVAAGTTNIGVSAGGKTSAPLGITVTTGGNGPHYTLTGPQNLTGNILTQ